MTSAAPAVSQAHNRVDLKRVGTVLSLFALCLAIILTVRFLVHAAHALTFPYNLVAGEGLLLRDAFYLRTGQPLYTDPNQFPYIVSVYPPGYTVLAALATLITGVHLSAVRLLSIAAVLISALLIPGIVYRLTRRRLPAIVAGLSYCGLLFVYQWGVFGRVDTVAVAWSLAAIGLALLTDRPDRGTGAVIGAALCCLGAVFTKQTALAAPIAIAIWLALRRPRLALIFTGTTLILGGSLFLTINVATGGQFFLQIVKDNVQTFSFRALGGYWRALILIDAPLLLGAIWYVISQIRTRHWLDLPLFYLIISGALTVTVGRNGASISYLLEFLAAGCLVFGLAWGNAEPLPERSLSTVVWPALIILQLIWGTIFPSTPLNRYYAPDPVFGYDPTPADTASCHKLDTYIDQTQGDILAEEAGILMEHGRVPIGSGWLLTALRGSGAVDQGKDQLQAQIVQHRFPLILLHWQSFPVDLLNTVAANYRQIDTVQCIYTWKVYQP